PTMTRNRPEEGSSIGYWAFWLQIAGMFGMTLSFATAGIGQVCLARVLGIGYLDVQLEVQVHFLMLVASASLFVGGVGLFIWDFFRHAPILNGAAGNGQGQPAGGAHHSAAPPLHDSRYANQRSS